MKKKLVEGAVPSLFLGKEEPKPVANIDMDVEEAPVQDYEFLGLDDPHDLVEENKSDVKEGVNDIPPDLPPLGPPRFIDPYRQIDHPDWDPFPDAPCDKVRYEVPPHLDDRGVSNEDLLKRRIAQLEQENKWQKEMLEKQQQIISEQGQKLAGVSKLFTPEQINLLAGIQTKPRYSDEAIKNSALIRYASGITAYEMMREIGYPFVDPSTISRRIDLKFKPGILDQNFKMLKVKSRRKPEYYKEAVLVIDEMKINPKIEYDPSTKELSGLASVPKSANSNSKGLDDNDKFKDVAQHGLVYYLCGVKERWKTVVGYDFTVASFDAKTVADRIRFIVKRANQIGTEVLELISDMGGCNQGV